MSRLQFKSLKKFFQPKLKFSDAERIRFKAILSVCVVNCSTCDLVLQAGAQCFKKPRPLPRQQECV